MKTSATVAEGMLVILQLCVSKSSLFSDRIFTSPPLTVRSIAISVSVCLSVCLCACLFARICQKPLSHMSKFHDTFCTCYLWPWLGLPLTTTKYVVYFRFWGWRHFYIMVHIRWLGGSGRRQATRHPLCERYRLTAAGSKRSDSMARRVALLQCGGEVCRLPPPCTCYRQHNEDVVEVLLGLVTAGEQLIRFFKWAKSVEQNACWRCFWTEHEDSMRHQRHWSGKSVRNLCSQWVVSSPRWFRVQQPKRG